MPNIGRHLISFLSYFWKPVDVLRGHIKYFFTYLQPFSGPSDGRSRNDISPVQQTALKLSQIHFLVPVFLLAYAILFGVFGLTYLGEGKLSNWPEARESPFSYHKLIFPSSVAGKLFQCTWVSGVASILICINLYFSDISQCKYQLTGEATLSFNKQGTVSTYFRVFPKFDNL